MSKKAMRLIDPSSGLMECKHCGSRHVANVQSRYDERNSSGQTRYFRGSWQCLNPECPSKIKSVSA
jgi:hypothetical protein